MTRADSAPRVPREWLGVGLLILVSLGFYTWFGWARFPRIQADQGWFLQVSQRVAQGEMLYRDVLWLYGPLPVMVMSGLMQLGRHDIAYYSALHIALATGATVVLYGLHRSVMHWSRALITTLLVTIGGGTHLLFLQAYTPGIAFGLFGVLLTLFGIQSRNRHRMWLIATGIATGSLSKPEYAFASFGTIIIGAVMLWRVRVDGMNHPNDVRAIFMGGALGAGIALAIYFYFATSAGWANVWAGLTGYARAQLAGDALIGYNGADTWLALATAFLILSAVKFIGAKKRWAWAAILCGLALTLFIIRARNLGTEIPLVSAQLYLTISLGVLALGSQMLTRWIRRESATRAQWILLVVWLGVQLTQLRYVLTGGLVPILGLALMLVLLETEFPAWSWRRQPIVFGAIALIALLAGINQTRLDFAANVRTDLPTPYGTVKVYASSRAFLSEVMQYVNANSQSTDAMAVMGPLAGIYYLTERHDPFRQDYQDPGLGENESDASDYLARLEANTPTIILIPQGAWSMGILNLREGVAPIRWTNVRAFRHAAPQIEAYIQAHYRFDQFLGRASSIELAAFKRVR